MIQNEFFKVTSGLNGTIEIPGDKSISHRAIMFGSLAEGETTVSNFLLGEDCLSTISCFEKLGVKINREGTSIRIEGKGFEGLKEPKELLDVGNSGTTIRLMLGILSGTSFQSTLAGDASIGKRPMKRVVAPLRLMGAHIEGNEDGNYTPLTVQGTNLEGIVYESPVASAQVKSAILLAGLRAKGQTTVIEKVKSRDHTERMLTHFGVDVDVTETKATVTGNQKLIGSHVLVPGDISSAAFWIAAGLLVPGSEIKLMNVGINPTRTGILEIVKAMGADIEMISDEKNHFEPVADLIIRSTQLKGTVIGGRTIPAGIDELPIAALMATQAEGTTIIKDAKELRVKETDRIQTVVSELSKLGANIEATEDGMIIHGPTPLTGALVESHGDHRIGMMLIVASMIAAGEMRINGLGAVDVSYPNFIEHYNLLKG